MKLSNIINLISKLQTNMKMGLIFQQNTLSSVFLFINYLDSHRLQNYHYSCKEGKNENYWQTDSLHSDVCFLSLFRGALFYSGCTERLPS